VPAGSADGGPRPAEAVWRVLAIAVGGSIGTLARYGVGRSVAVSADRFPWPTFLVNVAGSFLLGAIVVLVVERWPPTRFVRPFAAIGFCGGFTTFSTLAVDVARLGQQGRLVLASGTLALSVVAGIVAAALGMLAARGRLFPPRGAPIPDPDDVAPFRNRPTAGEPNEGGSGR
jgi:fluoride exporter